MDRYKTKFLTNVLLNTFSLGAVVGTGLLAPNAIKAIAPHLKVKSKATMESQRLLRHMLRLELIELEAEKGGCRRVRLTEKGKKRLKQSKRKQAEIKTPKAWDGLWRLVAFDIPTDLRRERYELLDTLRALGFIKLQQSMWVYPFKCEKELIVSFKELGLIKYMMFIEARVDKRTHQYLIKQFKMLLVERDLLD